MTRFRGLVLSVFLFMMSVTPVYYASADSAIGTLEEYTAQARDIGILTPAWGSVMWKDESATTAEHAFYISQLSGDEYRIAKDHALEVTRYCRTRDGNCFESIPAILEEEATGLPLWALSVDRSLRERYASVDLATIRGEPIEVIIEVADGALSSKAAEVWAQTADEVIRISEKIAAVPALVREAPSRPDEEALLHLQTLDDKAGTEAGRRIDLLNGLDLAVDSARREIYARTERALSSLIADVEQEIRALGGEIWGHTPVLPAVFARVPLSSVPSLASIRGVSWVAENTRMTIAMDVSPYAIYADTWWGIGYTGGVWDLAVVDTGIDGTHPALTVDYTGVFHLVAQGHSCYNDPGDADDYHGHGTHIAGTVTSVDATYPGVAYGMRDLINAKAGWTCTDGSAYMYWSDGMDAVDWAIQTAGADVVSLSFGGNPGSGDTPMARYFDAVVNDLGVMVSISAGNDGPGGTTVGDPATAYNVLSVGNMQDMNTVARGDDTIRSSSSRGPTGDGRLKPDITAPGTLITSANAFWETQADFVAFSGTSMATPHVAASLLLLMDKMGLLFPPMYKALLLNTADDWGSSGPDNTYGWGYLDLWEAEFNSPDVYDGYVDDGPVDYQFYGGPIFATETATLVWNRHVEYAGSDYPITYWGLNDLDLYAFNELNNSLIDASFSIANNVEQVVAGADYSSIVYKVEAFGALAGVSEERYALSVEELVVPVSPPILSIVMTIPASAEPGEVFNVSATVFNNGELNAHAVGLTLNLPAGTTLVSGGNPVTLGSIAPGIGIGTSWQVRGDATGSLTITSLASSYSYWETFTGASSVYVVDIVDTTPPVSSLSPLPAYETVPVFTVDAVASDWNVITSVQVYFRRDGGSWTSYGVDLTPPWSWSFDSSTTGGDGFYELYSIATDAATNMEPPPALPDASTVVDTGPPTSQTQDLAPYESPSFGVAVTAADSGSGVTTAELFYRRDGGPWVSYGMDLVEPWFWTFNSSATGGDGLYEFYSVAADALGNREFKTPAAEAATTVDTLPPATSHDLRGTIGEEGWYVSTVTVILSASDATSGVSVTMYRVDGGSWAAYTDSLRSEGEGDHLLEYYSRDAAGNNETTKSLEFKLDTSAPEIVFVAPAPDSWQTASVIVLWAGVDGGSGMKRYEIAVDGGDPVSLYDGIWGLTGLSDGSHTVTVIGNDRAGNRAEKTLTFRVDLVPPDVTIIAPSQDSLVSRSSVTLEWRITEDGSGVEACSIMLDDGRTIRLGDDVSQRLIDVSDGIRSATVTCHDVIGNEGRATVSFSVNTNPISPTGPFGLWLLATIVIPPIVAFGAYLFYLRRRQQIRVRDVSSGPDVVTDELLAPTPGESRKSRR